MRRDPYQVFRRNPLSDKAEWAKETYDGWCVDTEKSWHLDPDTDRWAGGKPRKAGAPTPEDAALSMAEEIARHTGRPRIQDAKPGRHSVGHYEVVCTQHAVVIAVALASHSLNPRALAAWRMILQEKLWLVQFDEAVAKALIACPIAVLESAAVGTILEALDDAVDEADALLGVFTNHPKIVETWLVWFSATGERLTEWR